MAFPKSCSLALDIRVLRDMGMVGQSRARLPLQRPQRALHVDLFRYEGCFGRSQYLRHASLPSSCFVRVSYNKWWLRCGEREGRERPLVSWCLVPFSRALIIRIDRASFAGKNLLKFCCHWLVRFPSSLSLSLFLCEEQSTVHNHVVSSLSAGSKDANDRRLIYSCVIFTSLSMPSWSEVSRYEDRCHLRRGGRAEFEGCRKHRRGETDGRTTNAAPRTSWNSTFDRFYIIRLCIVFRKHSCCCSCCPDDERFPIPCCESPHRASSFVTRRSFEIRIYMYTIPSGVGEWVVGTIS